MKSDIGLSGGSSRKHDYVSGMEKLGIPTREAESISSCLRKGKLPDYVVRAVIERERCIISGEEIDLIPDKYPWHPSVSDEISYGISEDRIDTGFVVKIAKAYVEKEMGKLFPAHLDIQNPAVFQDKQQ